MKKSNIPVEILSLLGAIRLTQRSAAITKPLLFDNSHGLPVETLGKPESALWKSSPNLTFLMKKVLCLLVLTFLVLFSFGQSTNYREYVGWLRANGYTIAEDRYLDISQGNSGVYYRTFYINTTYKILAFADDADVTDVDLYLDENGEEYSRDITVGPLAQLDFIPTYQRQMRVKFRNQASRYSSYNYRVRLLIAYR